jgi:ferredoxin-type protein NapH
MKKRGKSKIAHHRIGQIIASIITLGHAPAIWTGNIYQGSLKSACVPILNCWGCPLSLFSCPIGGLQHFLNLHLFPFYIIGFFGVIGMIVGRMVCGWLCPFGLLQDILQKIKTIKLRLPYWMTYIKYGVLIIVAGFIAWFTMEPWFCKLCPAGIIEAGIPLVLADKTGDIRALVGWLFWTKIAILFLIVIFSILIKRFFCRVFCPIGAIYSLFNRFSLVHLRIDKEKCPTCGFCATICPMDINVYDNPNQKECIRCLECVKKCPSVAVSLGFQKPNLGLVQSEKTGAN